MEEKSIFDYKNLYFIGIGGVSMSGICQLLLNEKRFNISGSDSSKTNLTEALAKENVKVYIGQKASNIDENIDLVIYTAAIKEDNAEFIRAKELNIKMMERAEFLGKLMKEYKYPLCVTGTHGKTTTTSMLSEVFIHAGQNPTISLGGILPSLNSNFKIGSKDYFILETCEYQDSFLKFFPHSAIILNIEKDHVDYFQELKQIYKSFKSFVNLIPSEACVVINSDIENYKEVIKDASCTVITYGKDKESQWQAENIEFDQDGYPSYTSVFKGKEICRIKLNVNGMHNVYNSLAVVALSYFYGIKIEDIEKGLSNFNGVNRRFQYKGTFNGVRVIDDYAHHPTEILATISSAKSKKYRQLWCAFQPHTYSRTKAFLQEFADSLANSDNIIILDIYSAREKDTGEISSKDLVQKLKEKNKNVFYAKDFEEAKFYAKENCKAEDIFITLGAGDVYILSEMLLED